ncbi:MAG TPA: 4-hydroxy-tetrahydrodipicolinate synthase [Phnomibacter sp.]|nr:4-hydroxy-tetrahydrodipicolinate synthase [Phnomibacter sp.]
MQNFSGVGVALVTPFNEDHSIDFHSLERLISYTIRGKVDYLVTLGTTGEVATLSEEEQLAVLAFTIEKAGRVPVVVGIGGNNTSEIVRKLQNWPLQNVAAVLSVSPYYNKPSQEGIYQHYAAIAKASPIPVILYNVPGRTSSNISAETTIRLANDFPGKIVGTKEASGNMVQCMHLVKNKPEGFALISGDDHITLPLIAFGFHGVISVVANSFPSEFCQLVHMAMNGNYAEARNFQSALLEKMDMLFIENNPAGVKAFLAEMGIIQNHLRLPLVPLSEKYMDTIRKMI